ncbi:MAG: branched-chain amino acid ABC transporter permease [Firmicutes bacterium]|jgi:branched-chain amino acid transport system permease protein|nr:branched-chain amino acid ABC transporter permease [Bacillota bacterium]
MAVNCNSTKKSIDNKNIFLWVALIALLVVAPFFFRDSRRVMHILTMCLIWGMVAESWNLILGYASVFSFGQLGFVAIGAYTSAMLSVHLGISPWIGLIAAGVAAGIVGALIGLPCLKLHGIYVGIVTFGISLVMPTLIVWGGQPGYKNLTGGTFGLAGLKAYQLFGFNLGSVKIRWYYTGLVLLAIVLYAIYKIIHSYVGLAFVSLRDSQTFAKSLGVNDYKYKIIVFSISACIAGIAGAFYAHYSRIIDPSILELDIFLLILVMVVLGGLGKFGGGVIGAFIITYINEILRPTGQYRYVILGALVIIVLTYVPSGIRGAIDKLAVKIKAGRT